MSGKKSNIVLSTVMLLIMLFVTICCVVPRNEIKGVEFSKDNVEHSYEDVVGVVGLEQEQNKFRVVGDDPSFQIELGATPIQSVLISIKADIKKQSDIVMYYADSENVFSEKNKISPIAVYGDEYAFDLKNTNTTKVRLDIDSPNFAIGVIKSSALQLNVEINKQDVNIGRVIGAILIPVALTLILYFTKIIDKLSDKLLLKFKLFSHWFKRNKLNVAFSALIYLAIGAVSAMAEFAYCHLVQRVPNSLGVYFDYYRFLFLFCALTTAFTLYLLRKIAGKKPEYIFLAVLLICGTMLTITLHSRTSESWDDEIHYEWIVTAPVVTDGSYTGIEQDNFKMRSMAPTDKYSYKYIKETQDSENIKDNLAQKAIVGEEKQGAFSLYERLGHLPSAITIQIFKTFDATHATQLFFGRMANLLVYALILFFAIKKLKTGKIILSVLGLIPTYVFLACNFSYDYWVTAFLYLGFAYFIDEWQHPHQLIEKKNLAIMLGSFILGCGPKSIYFVFLLLPLLLKKSKVKNYKKFTIACLSSCGFVVVAFLAISFLNISAGGDMRGGTDVNTIGQIKFILMNPLEYARILLSFLKNYIRIENLPDAFTGVAYINIAGGQIGILYTLLLFIVSFTDKNEHDIHIDNWKVKSSMLLFLFAECALLSTALYVSFNAVGIEGIGGVQLRYMFPLLFPVFAVIGTTNIKNNIDRKIYNFSIIGISATLFYVYFWTCHMTYFY